MEAWIFIPIGGEETLKTGTVDSEKTMNVPVEARETSAYRDPRP